MDALGTSEAKRHLLTRRHTIAALVISALLLWPAGLAHLEDGRIPSLDQGAVVAALASEADSSSTAERLRSLAMHGAKRGSPNQPGSPPV